LKRWFDAIDARAPVKRAVQLFADVNKPLLDDKAKEVLFGATQYTKR
jgi:GST-like protein